MMKPTKANIDYLLQFLTEGQRNKFDMFFTGKYDSNILKLVERTINKNKEIANKYNDMIKTKDEEVKTIETLYFEKLNNLREHYDDKLAKISEEYKSSIPEDKYYIEKRLRMLDALEAGGVDNWEWYSESLEDWYEKYK